MACKSISTISNWSFRQASLKEGAGSDEWKQTKHGRGSTQIHVDLLDAGLIPDSFHGLNEREIQWVGREDWEYKATFHCDEDRFKLQHKDLVFESLDTIASVFLNDENILNSENMFHIHRVDVSQHLKTGDNELRILFKSALKHGEALDAKNPGLTCWNGVPARLWVRKAQYHFGWDCELWLMSSTPLTFEGGPVMITAGPCRPIHLEMYNSSLNDVYIQVDVDENLSADIEAHFDISGSGANQVRIEIELEGEPVKAMTVPISQTARFHLEKPDLWYPWRYGKQTRYTFTTTLLDEAGRALDKKVQRIGIRGVRLLQQPLVDQPGKTFLFEVNNIPVFCAGSNWIPAENLETRLSDDAYSKWIQLAVEGNQDMIRVWGGGMYEDDRFYEACEQKGVLVWHDFMFGCGQYPCNDSIVTSVRKEAEDQLRRLRSFCCIVIWAGNNEDYQIAEAIGLTWDKDDHSGNYMNTNFPARTLYERVLPEAVHKMCPGLPYHPGSPWGGSHTRDKTEGDDHEWSVWHGSQEPYQDYRKLSSRFVSEFGMQAMPCRETVDYFLNGDTEECYPQSETVEFHNKADSWERRLALYVMANIKLTKMDMDSWIYATQLMQSECLTYAYRSWRRDWKGPGKEYCAGALVWQLNDCWPCTSWAIADHFGRPKLSYFAVKRESASLVVGIQRETDSVTKEETFDVWAVNSRVQAQPVRLLYEIFSIESGKRLSEHTLRQSLAPNAATELLKGINIVEKTPVVIAATLFDNDGQVLSRTYDWPQPLKHLHISPRKVSINMDAEKQTITLTCNKPVKGVELLLSNGRSREVAFSDNGFDICPGQEISVKVEGLRTDDGVSVRYYGQ